MKIKSNKKLLWTALLVAALMVVSAVAVSALPALKDASTANESYAAYFTDEDDAVTTLQSVMAEVEAGANVTLTLNADMSIPAGTTTIGTAASAGKLTITSATGEEALLLDKEAMLIFNGNVEFTNIALGKTSNAGSDYDGGFIVVAQGTGTFGTGIVASGSGENEKLSIAGKNLVVKSGEYHAIAPNHHRTGVNFEGTSIEINGAVTANIVAGKALYAGVASTGKTSGASTLSLQGSFVVGKLVGGDYVQSAVSTGNLTLTVNGGVIGDLYCLFIEQWGNGTGYNMGGAQYNISLTNTEVTGEIVTSSNIASDNSSKSAYGRDNFRLTINVTDSEINDFIGGNKFYAIAANGAVTTANIPWDHFGSSGATIAINLDGATVNGDFYAGSYAVNSGSAAGTGRANKDEAVRTITVKDTTFNGVACFGGGFAQAYNKPDQTGATTIYLDTDVVFNSTALLKSDIGSSAATHTGATTVVLKNGNTVLATVTGATGTVADLKANYNTITANYATLGVSFRVGSLAFRCRAQINEEFFDADNAAIEFNGLTVTKLGVKISNQTGTTIDKTVWEDDELMTNGAAWAANSAEGYNTFAAAIVGYGDISNLNAEATNKVLTFQPYGEFTAANGTFAVSIQSTTHSIVSAAEAFQAMNGGADYAAWIEGSALRRQTIEAIVATKRV